MSDKKILQQIQVPDSNFLTFHGKTDIKRETQLVITNPTDSVVAFKLKGTSPALIRMRPGYGYIKPKEKVSIMVVAMPFKERTNAPKRERVVLLLAVPPPTHPETAVTWWRTSPAPKDTRRQVFPIKFIEEGVVTKSPTSSQPKKDDTDDETEESSVHESTDSGNTTNTTEEST